MEGLLARHRQERRAQEGGRREQVSRRLAEGRGRIPGTCGRQGCMLTGSMETQLVGPQGPPPA